MDEPRRWTSESGEGRVDVDDVTWWACDPYPTWYRWEDVDGKRSLVCVTGEPEWRDV